MYFPKDIASLRRVYKYIIDNDIMYFIIGNGTNVLINERYFNQVFINLKNIDIFEKINDSKYLISSGKTSSKVAYELSKKGYTGLEFLSVIPGSIGGAIYMNAGAYNKEMIDIIEYVLFINEKAELVLMNKDECLFNYRTSVFQKMQGIIVGVIINIKKSKYKEAPIQKIREYVSNKKENQPLGQNNAGSTFKNLPNVNAWQIVDKLGYRGKTYGGAKVSNKHTNFIINNNGATFDDIYNLTMEIKEKAKEVLDIDLECEWKIIK